MINYIIIAIVIGIVAFSIYRYIKRQKAGGGCDCCGSCPQSSKCDEGK